MTDEDKIALTRFITLSSMFIGYVDENGIVAFINGYEYGRNNQDFTNSIREYAENHLSIPYSNTGWPGQITRYANKKSISWTIAFKQIALNVIALDGLNKEVQKILKLRIVSLINKICKNGDPWFRNEWVDEWNSLCIIGSSWFKCFWTNEEYAIIKSIGQRIKKNEVFADDETRIPTNKLFELKRKFDIVREEIQYKPLDK